MRVVVVSLPPVIRRDAGGTGRRIRTVLRARRCMWLSGFGVGIRLTLSIYRGSDTTDVTQESGESLGADNIC